MTKNPIPVQVDEAVVWQALAEMGRLGICVLDAEGAVVRVNGRMCEILGTESFMIEDQRCEDVRGLEAILGLDLVHLSLGRGKALWSGGAAADADPAGNRIEWLVWQRQSERQVGRMVILVRAADGAAGALKGKGGRRRTKAVTATPTDADPGDGTLAGTEAVPVGSDRQDSENY